MKSTDTKETNRNMEDNMLEVYLGKTRLLSKFSTKII